MQAMENRPLRAIGLHRLLISFLALVVLNHVCGLPAAGHQDLTHTAPADTEHHEHGADSLSACSPDAVPAVGSPDLAVLDTPVIFFAATPVLPATPSDWAPPVSNRPPLFLLHASFLI